MDGLFGLPRNRLADVQVFSGSSAAVGVGWHHWRRRPGTSFVAIFAVGTGGAGGNGAVGANSAAAGGGGGGSAGQSVWHSSGLWLPDDLFISVGMGPTAGGTTIPSRVAIVASTTANDTILWAGGGGNGSNAAAGTAGAAGPAGAVTNMPNNPLAGMGVTQYLAGQAGIIGGTTVSGAALAAPVTGLVITGGTGGGGLPAAATAGTNGGFISVSSPFPTQKSGAGGTSATTPGENGSNGFQPFPGLQFFYGGTGGGSTHGSATGAGLQAGNGGNGSYGSGGGGGGGALTGGTAGLGGRGGDGLVVIVSV